MSKAEATATPPSTPVLRVKRRRSQSPADALLLHFSAKKRKESSKDEGAETPKKVFKFTATLDSKVASEKLKDVLVKSSPSLVKSDPKLLKRIVDKKDKTKESSTGSDKEKRYKLISDRRGIEGQDTDSEESLFKLYDVVSDVKEDPKVELEHVDRITCNGVPLVKLAEEEYVYDVYTMESDELSSPGDHEASFNIDDFDIDISFLDCRDIINDPEHEDYRNPAEDSDSNDEDHWKNDYPDEESDDYDEGKWDHDDDVGLDFDNFHLRHGNPEIDSLSEDDSADDLDQEDLVYSRRDEDFQRDCNLHGTSYAKWKRQMVKEMGGDQDEDDYDINEIDEF